MKNGWGYGRDWLSIDYLFFKGSGETGNYVGNGTTIASRWWWGDMTGSQYGDGFGKGELVRGWKWFVEVLDDS